MNRFLVVDSSKSTINGFGIVARIQCERDFAQLVVKALNKEENRSVQESVRTSERGN